MKLSITAATVTLTISVTIATVIGSSISKTVTDIRTGPIKTATVKVSSTVTVANFQWYCHRLHLLISEEL